MYQIHYVENLVPQNLVPYYLVPRKFSRYVLQKVVPQTSSTANLVHQVHQ